MLTSTFVSFSINYFNLRTGLSFPESKKPDETSYFSLTTRAPEEVFPISVVSGIVIPRGITPSVNT